ncbi:FAD-dependent oxidoreductase, partial [bacterium]|nr:FAD-dependent oxidoreductase [bacterium]
MPGFSKNPQHLNIPAKTAVAHKNLLTKLESEPVIQVQKKSNCLYFNGSAAKTITKDVNFGIIAGGVSTSYALEILLTNLLSGKVAILKVGMTHPFPNNDVLEFLKHGFDKILILEESDPIIENEVRILAQKNQLTTKILGKEFGGLSRVGEYSLDIIRIAIREFVEMSLREKKILPSKDIDRFLNVLPPRPPALCPGCSHRATYYALKLALQKDRNKLFLCGDIGCFALGAFPPFQLIDSIHHMGMSVSMAQGLSEAIQFGNGEKQKIVALVGDGTFFHSSVASLMNAVYTKANITVIIFDNRNIGMTGHQPNPGAVQQDSNREVDLPKLLKGIGVEFVDTVDPNNVIECFESINNAVSYKGVSVVVTQSPCVFLPEFKVKTLERIKKVTVDPNLCNTCHNQEDNEIFCSKEFSPDIALVKARAKLIARDHIQAKEQACPANICNHEFFNSLLNGDYKSALNVVRDKMLFARICGDLCHKPCEFMFRTEDQKVVPIRELKHFVAGFETNFEDFSIQEKRVKTAPKREQSIAIVGSGPAGLSAAYDLIQLGYDVTVFERESYAGGLLKSAIPAFRMDKKGLEKEVSILQNLGVKFRFNTSLGRDTKLEDISSTFEGVILAIGMGAHTTMDVIEENIAPEQNFDAVGFLEKYNLNQLNLKKQATLFVIGGGNSALDAARAAKEYGIDRVTIVYRRSREEMPAFNEEIEEAINEGVEILHHRVIDSCFTDDSGKINLSLKSFGNGEPKGSLRGDYIVSAIGQKGNVEDFSELLKSDWSGRVTADSSSGKTDYKNVFVAGDICAENHVSIIGAIASGKRAATGIRQLIEGYKYDY